MASLHDPFSSGASVANEAALFPVASFRLLFRDLSPATQFQNSGALRESFMPSKPKPCRRLTHRQVWVPGCNAALASSGAYFLRAAPEKKLPRRFLLSDAGLFLVTTYFSAPADQHELFQQSKSFHFVCAAVLPASMSVGGCQIPWNYSYRCL